MDNNLKQMQDTFKTHHNYDVIQLLIGIVFVVIVGIFLSTTAKADDTSDVGIEMYNKLTDEQKQGYDNVLIIQDYSNKNVYRYFLYNGKLTLTPSTTWSGCFDYQFSDGFKSYRTFADGSLGSESNSNPAYSTKTTCVYSNQAIYDTSSNLVFQLPPRLGAIVEMKEMKITTVLLSLKLLIPLLIVLIVSWICLRKCWNFLRVVLKAS